jgi:hypothetical protein
VPHDGGCNETLDQALRRRCPFTCDHRVRRLRRFLRIGLVGGACANVWRPVTTSGAPKAGKEAVAAKLGTSKRRNGTLQVTYNGHPLYTYAGDAKSGQTNGQDSDEFGAEWYVLSPAGNTVESGGS